MEGFWNSCCACASRSRGAVRVFGRGRTRAVQIAANAPNPYAANNLGTVPPFCPQSSKSIEKT
eukprot:5019493-Amphidinium_carterae.1